LVFLSLVEGVQFSFPTVLVPFSLYFLQKLQLLVVSFTSPEKRSFAVSTLCTSVNSVFCFTRRQSCNCGPFRAKEILSSPASFSGRAAVDQAYCNVRIYNVSASASLTAVLNHTFIVSSGREDQTSGNRKNPVTKRHIPEHRNPQQHYCGNPRSCYSLVTACKCFASCIFGMRYGLSIPMCAIVIYKGGKVVAFAI